MTINPGGGRNWVRDLLARDDFPFDHTPDPPPREGKGHFVAGLLAVEREQAEGLTDTLGEPVSAEPRLEAALGLNEGALDRIFETVTWFTVDDVLGTVRHLDEQEDVIASPIYVLRALNHQTYKPGNDPRRPGLDDYVSGRNLALSVDPQDLDDDKIAAVIDTGLAAIPQWLAHGLEADPVDAEAISQARCASHGTFVTSIVRVLAPDVRLSFAAAKSLPPSIPISNGGDAPDHEQTPHDSSCQSLCDDHLLTTEAHIQDALIRLRIRHERTPDALKVLNLSFGGTGHGTRNSYASLRLELEKFKETFSSCRIFAAAGNSGGRPPAEVFPAAFDFVDGVGAGERTLGRPREIVWEMTLGCKQIVLPAPQRGWSKFVCPGSEILGMGGLHDRDFVLWSGSSFATAIASGLYARNLQIGADPNRFWPTNLDTVNDPALGSISR